ncbi:hypothetical protein BCR32DRAFT_307976 [Anaeromyces robustus]|uniref:Uncharacterized protein n=1 Tax=Anaeromyces robustus TaxID=1754192 RepID=A0A1Y1XD06_9FUNG|nr:hypothetical protein BCR32DRAFT_307976 [Anaeromyces robustus]|eukprot:ORX83671.1 hypothetical protein BCR32DRAFT_307976 [Anaeromyces robustus]
MKFIYLYCFMISTFLFSGVISVDNVDRNCVESVNADMSLFYKYEDRVPCDILCNLKRLFITEYCSTIGTKKINGESNTCYKANQKCMWESTNFCKECVENVFADMYVVSENPNFGLFYKNIPMVLEGRPFPSYECFCTAKKKED